MVGDNVYRLEGVAALLLGKLLLTWMLSSVLSPKEKDCNLAEDCWNSEEEVVAGAPALLAVGGGMRKVVPNRPPGVLIPPGLLSGVPPRPRERTAAMAAATSSLAGRVTPSRRLL